MPSRRKSKAIDWRAAAGAASAWTLSILTTAALAAIGWQGHRTHWTFGFGPHGSGGHASAPRAVSHESASGAEGTIRFGSKEAMERTGIELVPVEERPLVSELAANGVVRYDERRIAQLSARVPGTVWRVEKHLGDHVRQGEVLLIVESREVGRLKADFLNCLVAHESRLKQLEILEEVQGAVMGRQIREARSAVRESRNHLINAEQALVNLGFDVRIAAFEPLDDEQRADAIRTVGVAECLSAGEARHATSNLMPLHAPFDGVVIGRDVVVGEVIEPSTPIFEVADVSTMWVVLNVNKEDAGRVAIGQPVRFRADGSDEDCVSRVSWISTEVDPQTRTLEVRAEIVNAPSSAAAGARADAASGHVLRANTFGVGRIEVGRRGTALVVPSESLQWDGSRWVVFVPAGEMAFEPLAVNPGLRDGDRVEIVGDLAGRPLTHVVGAGSHVLKSKILLDRIEAGEL
ncbi:MAG: HlyD family efflux transporter periplasmic adaptor subunit [Planctomycetia bacterium]|nr:HlyD family efflux transporter periplasmic adaptor subunit [Planctomycetia bacterium]